jgi:hypothetical protein
MSLILSGTDGLSDVDGSASTPAIRGTDANTGIFFPATDTIAFAEGGAEIARFNSSGNLGIGITTPNTELHVQGAPTTDGSIVFNEQLTATTAFNASPQSGTMVSLKYNTGGDYAGLGGWSVIKENATDGNFAGATLFHSRPNGGAITERMRIDSSGNLLVGNSSGNARLFVKGSSTSASDLCFMFQNSSASTVLAAYNNGAIYADGLKSGAGTNAVKFSTATGQVTYDTSSARYKDNIRDSVYGLNHVMQMRSTQFEYKDDGRSDVGLIAEELQPIVPELVGLDKNGQADSVSYDRMVSVLVKAVQEQQAIITDLKSRIEALEAK